MVLVGDRALQFRVWLYVLLLFHSEFVSGNDGLQAVWIVWASHSSLTILYWYQYLQENEQASGVSL